MCGVVGDFTLSRSVCHVQRNVRRGRMMQQFRWAISADNRALAQIMYDAIHHVPSHYTAAQQRAWLPAPPKGKAWSDRLAQQRVAVAQQKGDVVGFVSLAAGGYVDLAYITPAAQGQGVFRALVGMIENEARAQDQYRLHTHASLMAQPAFLALGFHVIRHESVARSGQTLDRAEMEKVLK